ncbi:nuatigenin 3-beta-glucosyltransferase-like [Rutidosis leptorrhynchoides]|uniref:nuatigenin 3-beta-glucosyltransferase-like n=1 Tax=Rutidosis leptorrhynchoides TaxID=125765 RepID=UPI003A9927C2
MSNGRKYTSDVATDFHVVFLPLPSPSHMIPLVDVARLFSARGVRSTIVTSHHSLSLLQNHINFDLARGYPISVHIVNIPPGKGMAYLSSLQKPIEQVVRNLDPNCIFSDMFFTWTVDLAEELKIPRLLFYPNCLFSHSVLYSLKQHYCSTIVKSKHESFVVPDLPDKITMKKSRVPDWVKLNTVLGDYFETVLQSGKRSFGLVYNTCYEIEPAYVDHMKKSVKGTKIWHIGPLFEYFNNKNYDDCMSNKHESLTWLDNQKPKSVIYVCFGSLTTFQEAQITEIALALDECDQPFVWVIRRKEDNQEGINNGLPQGFEERIRKTNKGLIIRDWAPQVEILQHAAIGGFLTHCGWGSVLEAVVAGVPLVTWPLTADHFEIEKLVELLEIGVKVGAEVYNMSFDITSPIIEKRTIVDAIVKLQDGSIIGENMRQNLKVLSNKVKQSVQEGGSSFNNLTGLIEDIKAFEFSQNN